MEAYEVTIVLEIDAMHEESAENKLEAFLSGLDLKKNDKVFCKTVGDLTKVGGDEVTPETEASDELDEDDWDEDWEDLDFDTIGDEENAPEPAPEPVVEDAPLSDESGESTESVIEVEDEDGFTVLLNQINNPAVESTDTEEAWWDEDEEWPEE